MTEIHRDLEAQDGDDSGIDYYNQITVTTGKVSQYNNTSYQLFAFDGNPLTGPHGDAYWQFSGSVPDLGDIIRVSLKAKRKTGQNAKPGSFYQDVGGWTLYDGDTPPEMPTQAPQQSSGSSGRSRDYSSPERTDATGRSIERQVAYKGVVELAAAGTSVHGDEIVEMALAMAEELWGERLPVGGFFGGSEAAE